MNALQRLAVRLYDAVVGEPPALPPLSRGEIDRMSLEEIQAHQRRVRAYLDSVEKHQRHELDIEARGLRRKGGT